MRRSCIFFLLLLLTCQTSCIWKLWSKGPPIEEQIFDIYGEVESVTLDKLVIQGKGTSQEFVMVASSIKGSDFVAGDLVHVFYRFKGDVKEVTMAVKKIR